MVRLVNEILAEAIEARASDIHIEAQEKRIKIRYRIDGVLQKQSTPPEMHQFRAAIISRLKIMAKLNEALNISAMMKTPKSPISTADQRYTPTFSCKNKGEAIAT